MRRQLRVIDAPFVVPGPSGVAVRDRLKNLTPGDDAVLRRVGEHLGRLACLDLKNRCADGLDHSADAWAARKQGLTAASSSRWAGSITKGTHDQWALSRRCQLAHIQSLQAGVRTLTHRLSQPIGEKGTKRAPGGYRSRGEWFHKSRRLHVLEHRLGVARAERKAGVVHVVRGGRRLLNNRARASGVVGVDTNADHFAACRLDVHGNPVGDPKRFFFDLSGTADHRDAQIRHAISRLLHWARRCGVAAIGIEDLDVTAEKTREKHGRKKRFRQLVCGIPTGRLKARLVSMAAEQDLSIVAVDPAYTSVWGNQHWRKPLTSTKRKMSRHDAAGIAIGRRALGHLIRMGVPPRPFRHWGRTAPPPQHQSDAAGHRTAQAGPGTRAREETRRPVTERAHDARRRTGIQRTRATSASSTVRNARSSGTWRQMSLLDTV
jgi:hypothetical protein